MCDQEYIHIRTNDGSLWVIWMLGHSKTEMLSQQFCIYCAKNYCLVKPWEEWVTDRILSSVFSWELPQDEDIGPYKTYYSQRAIFSLKKIWLEEWSGEFLHGRMWKILIADNPPGTEHVLRDKLLQSKVDEGQTVQLKEWQASLVISLSNYI